MGWTYNTTDPDAPTIGPMITGVAIALTVISFLTVCLRVYVRGFLIKAFGIGKTPPVYLPGKQRWPAYTPEQTTGSFS